MSKLTRNEKVKIHDQCLEFESEIWESVESLGDQRVKNYESGEKDDLKFIIPILNEIIEDCERYKEYINSETEQEANDALEGMKE